MSLYVDLARQPLPRSPVTGGEGSPGLGLPRVFVGRIQHGDQPLLQRRIVFRQG